MKHVNNAVVENEVLDKVGYKMEDLELKVNILTYKMQYGSWPMPHQIHKSNFKKNLRNLRLTLSSPNDRNDWIKNVLLRYQKIREEIRVVTFSLLGSLYRSLVPEETIRTFRAPSTIILRGNDLPKCSIRRRPCIRTFVAKLCRWNTAADLRKVAARNLQSRITHTKTRLLVCNVDSSKSVIVAG